jgi:hypothetical protein
LERLAAAGGDGAVVKRPKRERDTLDKLVDKYQAKLEGGGGRAGKPRPAAGPRWFE